MKFGLYVHIPYCLQRCVYCDFATYEQSQILPPQAYLALLTREVRLKAPLVGPRDLDTLYFGGGTPSLLEASELESVIKTLAEYGFKTKPDAEVTLEINPATVDEAKLDKLLEVGFNRFSIGVQTFSEKGLKIAKRKHSSLQTRQTLALFQKYKLNYSGDILFALPEQTLQELKADVEELLNFGPKHVSPYYLTVPESNPMAQNRPLEDDQIKMFEILDSALRKANFQQYEISNYSLPGFESRHNQIYWNSNPYWGIGLSSHSYLHQGDWGLRFWSPRNIQDYEKHLLGLENPQRLSDAQMPGHYEFLKKHEAQTDFVHTALRTSGGLNLKTYQERFGSEFLSDKKGALFETQKAGLLEQDGDFLRLTPKGRLLSNRVFETMLFSAPQSDS